MIHPSFLKVVRNTNIDQPECLMNFIINELKVILLAVTAFEDVSIQTLTNLIDC